MFLFSFSFRAVFPCCFYLFPFLYLIGRLINNRTRTRLLNSFLISKFILLALYIFSPFLYSVEIK